MRLLTALLAIPALAVAQAPRIGIIDFYGAGRVNATALRKVAGVRVGDPLPASKAALEERLEAVPGVVAARLTAMCCEAGRAILYVGIEEKGAPHFELRAAPSGSAQLPAEIAEAYVRFLAAAGTAARAGDTAEDLTRGHSLMRNAAARTEQERFVELARANLASLRAVLRESPDEEQRAMAAYVIGYAPDKAQIVDDLLYALQDPDETVRENALRSIGALAVYARTHPAGKVQIRPAWIVEMLNSISWADRHSAAVALVTLSDSRDPELLGMLRERARGSLAEMAAWQHLPHALPAYILIGRVLGMPEKEIEDSWSAGRRAAVIQKFGAARTR